MGISLVANLRTALYFFLLMPAFVLSTDILTHLPTKCESCIIFSRELDNAVSRLPPKMRPEEGEAWLIEQIERVCDRMLQYRVHKEKEGISRFAKEVSGTFKTIKQLADKGVKNLHS
jgi:hypothetical protein